MTFKQHTISLNGKTKQLKWVAADQGCFDYIQRDWAQFSHMFMREVTNWDAIVQAGGNCGLYPLYHSVHFERVFTFEPDPMNFYCLAENCPNNKIIKFNTALSDAPRFVGIGNPDPSNVGMPKVGAGGTVVYAMPIDSLDLQSLGLLHLDVEGHELEALKGGIETIRRCKPVIALELLENAAEIQQLLTAEGYKKVAWYGQPLNEVWRPV